LPTVIFLILIINAIFIYINNVEDISPTVVQQVVKDKNGVIWALFGNKLIDLADVEPTKSFASQGFDNHVGQIVPLRSGEWLLNVGAQSDYVKKALQRKVLDPKAEYQTSGSLIKCDAKLLKCSMWGEAELQFERAFEGVELDDGRFLLFKAESKRIFLVSSLGIILDQIDNQEMWFGVTQNSKGQWFGLNTTSKELLEIVIEDNSMAVKTLNLKFRELEGDVEKIINRSKTVENEGHYWLLGYAVNKRVSQNTELSKLEKLKEITVQNQSLLSIDSETNIVRHFDFIIIN